MMGACAFIAWYYLSGTVVAYILTKVDIKRIEKIQEEELQFFNAEFAIALFAIKGWEGVLRYIECLTKDFFKRK